MRQVFGDRVPLEKSGYHRPMDAAWSRFRDRLARLTDQPGALFLAFSLGFGALFVFLAPPFQAPDEPAHLFRAWAISEGRVRAQTEAGIQGAWIPVSLLRTARAFLGETPHSRSSPMTWKQIDSALQIRLEPEKRIFVAAPGGARRQPFSNAAAGYTPAGYVATSAAILLGRAFEAPPVILVYLARLANLILSTALGWLAIARTPYLKWAFTWVLLFPMSLHLRSAISVDGLLISLAFLTVAEILRGTHASKDLSPALALLSAGWLCLIKQGYSLVPLLTLAIPAATNRKRRWVTFVAALLAVVFVASAAAMLFPRDMKTPIPPQERAERAQRAEAAREVPLTFVRNAARYWLDFGGAHAREFVGNLGWLDTPVPIAVGVAALWILVLLTQVDGIPEGRPLLRAWAALLFAATAAFMTYHVHIGTQGSRFIDGIQGRYFLPLAPLAMVAIGWRLPLMARVRQHGLVVAILSFSLLSLACVLLLQRHWL